MTVYKCVTISDAESVEVYCNQFAADGYELRAWTDTYLVFSKEQQPTQWQTSQTSRRPKHGQPRELG